MNFTIYLISQDYTSESKILFSQKPGDISYLSSWEQKWKIGKIAILKHVLGQWAITFEYDIDGK